MAISGSFLDLDGFKARTIAPAMLVDGLHIPQANAAERAAWTTFVEAQLVDGTAEIKARLRKRYVTEYPDGDVPRVLLGWLAAIVTPALYERRGWDPSDEQAQRVDARADRAREQMKEAADAVAGLFDVPLLHSSTASGISKGGPLVYSEPSPWDWTDAQREALR